MRATAPFVNLGDQLRSQDEARALSMFASFLRGPGQGDAGSGRVAQE